VIHFLADCGDARPRRKIVGVVLAMIKLQQALIVGMQLAAISRH
jgi:hypothetical protein